MTGLKDKCAIVIGVATFSLAATTASAAPGFGRVNQLSSQSSSSQESKSSNDVSLIEMFQQFVQDTLKTPKPYLGIVGAESSPTKSKGDKDTSSCDHADAVTHEDEEEDNDSSAATGPEPIYFGF